MSYLEYNAKYVPTGFRKLFYLNWPVIILITAVAGAGFIMLYSVRNGGLIWGSCACNPLNLQKLRL